VFSFVGETNQDLVGALDDVEVGEDQPALVDDDPGPEAGPAELGARVGSLGAEELIEEITEEGVVVTLGQVRPAPLLRPLDGGAGACASRAAASPAVWCGGGRPPAARAGPRRRSPSGGSRPARCRSRPVDS